MDNEEKYLNQKFGKENPFRVPDGYFDQLTDRVMAQLPERRKKSRFVTLRPWLYAAACVACVVVLGVTFLSYPTKMEQPENVAAIVNNDNTYIDEAADYAMLDNAEIYACLADN